MRNKVGKLFMLLGSLLILGSLVLFFRNIQESSDAEHQSHEILAEIRQELQIAEETQSNEIEFIPDIPVELLTEEDLTMTEVMIDGHGYIGYLTIPDMGLELPIMSDWSYKQLKIAPCRYDGTLRGKDLVIMAHNYKTHFGRLSKLSLGASVIFTDMDSNAWPYEIVAIDVLEPTAVEEMTAGEYDLTLFTCTPGGSYRVTVRCMQIQN